MLGKHQLIIEEKGKVLSFLTGFTAVSLWAYEYEGKVFGINKDDPILVRDNYVYPNGW